MMRTRVLETCTELEQIYTKKELYVKLVIYKKSISCFKCYTDRRDIIKKKQ